MDAPELMETWDDNRKYKNYTILMNTISFLESNGHITEDWMEENKDRITLYRECFEDFTKVNPEIQDPKFRKIAEETEIMMSYLYIEVMRTHTFTVGLFLQLNKHILALVSWVTDDDDLTKMFESIALH